MTCFRKCYPPLFIHCTYWDLTVYLANCRTPRGFLRMFTIRILICYVLINVQDSNPDVDLAMSRIEQALSILRSTAWSEPTTSSKMWDSMLIVASRVSCKLCCHIFKLLYSVLLLFIYFIQITTKLSIKCKLNVDILWAIWWDMPRLTIIQERPWFAFFLGTSLQSTTSGEVN